VRGKDTMPTVRTGGRSSITAKHSWDIVIESGPHEVKQLNKLNESNNGTQPYMQNRVYDGDGIAPAVTQFANQMKVVEPNFTYEAANKIVRENEFYEGEPKALDFYNHSVRDDSPTLTDPKHNNQGLFDGYRIRRLTPIECERLQGFPDNHTKYGIVDGEVKEMANTHRYKQCGNAVTVDVVEAVAKQIKKNLLL
jgi:DNA (cytosine-5)-methyltransferase 1